MSDEPFSVYQFFDNNTFEEVRSNVNSDEAVKAFNHCSKSVGARLGTTTRVIITDNRDDTVVEWLFGQGVVFPK